MTVVMISQRASTIKNADRILVLDDGRSAVSAPMRRFWKAAGFTEKFAVRRAL